MSNIPISQLPAATEAQSSDVLAGVQSGATKKFSLAVILNWIKNTLTPANIGAIPTSARGAASGVAELDSNGKVPTSQLPTFPSPSSATPQDLGTAAAGSSTDYSRADHVHQRPTYSASDVGLGNVDNVRQYSANNQPPYPVTSVNGATGAVTVSVPSISTSTPSMDGTAAAGSTGQVSDAGHTHPTDVSRVPVYGLGENLLRNWYFMGGGTGRGVFPVNRRGATSGQTTNDKYFIDAWKTTYGSSIGTWSLTSSGLTITPAAGTGTTIFQSIDDTLLDGKSITASVLLSDGRLITGTLNSRISGTTQNIGTSTTLRMLSNGSFRYTTSTTNTLKAIKLELGSKQTLCHNEGTDANPVWVLNEIPDYEEELIKCQTSTADSSDTYANKSLATEQQLAYVESGSTASRAYAEGEYFCWGGALYRAKTAISSGDPFTVGTNCESKTVGAYLIHEKAFSGTTGTYGEIGQALDSGHNLIGVKLTKVGTASATNTAVTLYAYGGEMRGFYITNVAQGTRVANTAVEAVLFFI